MKIFLCTPGSMIQSLWISTSAQWTGLDCANWFGDLLINRINCENGQLSSGRQRHSGVLFSDKHVYPRSGLCDPVWEGVIGIGLASAYLCFILHSFREKVLLQLMVGPTTRSANSSRRTQNVNDDIESGLFDLDIEFHCHQMHNFVGYISCCSARLHRSLNEYE